MARSISENDVVCRRSPTGTRWRAVYRQQDKCGPEGHVSYDWLSGLVEAVNLGFLVPSFTSKIGDILRVGVLNFVQVCMLESSFATCGRAASRRNPVDES